MRICDVFYMVTVDRLRLDARRLVHLALVAPLPRYVLLDASKELFDRAAILEVACITAGHLKRGWLFRESVHHVKQLDPIVVVLHLVKLEEQCCCVRWCDHIELVEGG